MMNLSRKLIEDIRAKLKFLLVSLKDDITDIIVKNIPDKWEDFSSSLEGRWIKLKELDNYIDNSACLYEATKGCEFNTHKHPSQNEQLVILNPKGAIRIITPEKDIILRYPEGTLIKKGIPHHITFLEDSLILCNWTPCFENEWIGEFNQINFIKNVE
jgi:hypothetical protein